MRRRDLHNASELRARLERAGGAEWVELRALRTWFGGRRLSRARRRRIAAALKVERIDAYPPRPPNVSAHRLRRWRRARPLSGDREPAAGAGACRALPRRIRVNGGRL